VRDIIINTLSRSKGFSGLQPPGTQASLAYEAVLFATFCIQRNLTECYILLSTIHLRVGINEDKVLRRGIQTTKSEDVCWLSVRFVLKIE
jgi:hypothetical protein